MHYSKVFFTFRSCLSEGEICDTDWDICIVMDYTDERSRFSCSGRYAKINYPF